MKRGSSNETRDKRSIEDLIDALEYLLRGQERSLVLMRRRYKTYRAQLYRQVERIQRRRGA